MSTSTVSSTAAQEAWGLFWRIFTADKARRMATLNELGLAPMQSMALMQLKPGEPLPMSALATALMCDNSNVTGIVDRLEAPPEPLASLSAEDARALRDILRRAGASIDT